MNNNSKTLVLPLLLALLLFGCSNETDATEKIDGSSANTFEKSISEMSKSLNEADKEVFSTGLMRLVIQTNPIASKAEGFAQIALLEKALENAHIHMDGITKKEIMAAGLEAVKNEQETQIKEKIKCYNGSRSDLVHVEDWKITPLNSESNSLSIVLSNSFKKPIRMIDASLTFKDKLGESIGTLGLKRDININPNEQFRQINTWGLNTFERLLELQKRDVETFVCVKSVIYEDGTVKKYKN